MFRHWIWIIAASVVLALTMVACGEDEEPEQVVIAEPPVSAGAEEEQAEPSTPIVAVIVTPTPAEEEADQAEAEATPAEGEAEATPTGEAEAEATSAEGEAEATPAEEAEAEAEDQAEAEATPAEEAEAEATPAEGEEAEATPTGEAEAEATPAGEEEAEVDIEQLISQGEEIYSANCAACHGPDGQGGGEYPALAGNEFLTGDPAQAIEVVHNGRGAMPAFGEQLSNEEIAAVLSYERNSWGNEAEAITPDQVAQVAEGGEAGETTEVEATPTPAEEAETQAEPGPTAEGTPEEGTEDEETDKPSETETPVSGEAADPEQLVTIGEGIYQSYCAACHQPDGQGVQARERGVAPIYPPLAGNPFVTAEDPNAVTLTVLTGRAGMPRFRDMLENEQIAAVVSYIRNAWDNDASTVSTQEVEQILQSFLDRPEPNDKEGSMARKTPTATPAASD